MATTVQQRRYRARDSKRLVQIRLSPEAVAYLDQLVAIREATGRAEVLEGLLIAPTPRVALTVARRALMEAGRDKLHGVDAEGYTVQVRRFR